MRYRVAVLVFVLFAVALLHADDSKRYFSVSTGQSYAPGEKPSIHLYAHDVGTLEFRVYSVKDPVKFFEQFSDVHGFGPQEAPKERLDKPSLLERFHDWKMSLWHWARSFFHDQYTAEARNEFHAQAGKNAPRTRLLGATGFANVPLLNSSRLISRWKVEMPPSYVSEALDLPLDSLDSGVYLVEATDGSYRAYTVVVVTKLAMAVKSSTGRLLAFVTDRNSGEPIPDVTVTTWLHGRDASTFTTGKQGVGEGTVNPPTQAELAATVNDSEWVLAQHGRDVALVAPESLSLSNDPENDLTGYVYTERPVYRPGDTVQYKIILRRRDGARLLLPGKTANVKIDTSDGNVVQQKSLSFNDFGTASGSLELPRDASLGYYSIELDKGGVSGSFQVEEYRKPEYFVKITPEKSRVLQGESFRAVIEARYYYGEPVANARVDYSVSIEPSYFFDDEEDEDSNEPSTAGGGDEGGGSEDSFYMGQQVSSGSGQLDASGRLTIAIPTRIDEKRHRDLTYRVEADVKDNANRVISGHNAVLVTSGNFHLSVQAQSYLCHVGENAQLVVHAVDYDKHPVSTPVAVELQDSNGKPFAKATVSTDSQGYGRLSLPVAQAGSMRIVATADSAGRKVEARSWLWAMQPGESSWWGGEESNSLRLVADKSSYKVGDVAHVLILGATKDATMLVTAEGESVIAYQVVRSSGGDTTVDIPVTEEFQPNAYVTALFFKSGKLYQGGLSLKVPPVTQRLQLDITPSKPQFEPGEKAVYKISAKDWSGKPVSAELSVGIVDDAVYAVEPDRSGDIVSAFHPQRYGGVNTNTSLEFYFHGEAGNKSVRLTEHRFHNGDRSRLAQVKASELAQPKIRKAFPDTAYWQAQLHTDANGEATVSMTFPDSLTTWRTTVRAVTKETLAGWAVNRVIVRKNLIVRLATPRFLRTGDSVAIGALTQNYLASPVTAHVSLDTQGAQILSGASQEMNINSHGEGDAWWRLRPTEGSSAVRLTAKSLTNVESDAMELTLPVVPFGVRQTINQSGVIGEMNGSRNAALNFPESNSSSRGVDLELAPSVMGSLFGGLEYLTSFPYGCTEQTLSSFIPDVVASMAMRDLTGKSPIDAATLKVQVEAGAQRLYGYQHEDGGWGWWQEDESTVYMTSYAVYGLSLAKKAGFPVRDDAIQRGRQYLLKVLAEHPRMIADLQAYALRALTTSGSVDKTLLNSLWSKKSDLTPEGVAVAGEALLDTSDGRAQQAAQLLRQSVRQEGDGSYWHEDNDYLLDVFGDNSVEATASAVKLLSRLSPNDTLLPRAVLWLMRHRNEGAYWSSTKQTATVIYGVLEYLRATHELSAGFDATVTINGRKVLSHRFTAADVLSPLPLRLHLDASQLGRTNNIAVQKSGGGRLYWSVRGSYYSTARSLYNQGSLSLNIVRQYFRLKPVNNGEQITYDLVPLSGAVSTGEVIAVRLTVSGGDWRYLLIEDPIPAGTEFLPRNDLYRINHKPSWWWEGYTRREFHDDHAAFFHTYFHERGEYFYLLRAVNPGEFGISPATAQPMYQPEVQAATDPAYLEVKQ